MYTITYLYRGIVCEHVATTRRAARAMYTALIADPDVRVMCPMPCEPDVDRDLIDCTAMLKRRASYRVVRTRGA